MAPRAPSPTRLQRSLPGVVVSGSRPATGEADRRRLLIDIRPLRESPEFRRLWIGGSLSAIGSQMTAVAVAVQVYDLTRSSFAVGAIGFALAVPMIVLGLVGGSIADSTDRRRLVLVTNTGLTVVAGLFAVQALLGLRQLWLLYALTAVSAGLSAIETPARRTFIPRLLPPGLLPAALALSKLSFQLAMIVAPLVAGVLIAQVGLEATYVCEAATFVVGFYSVLRLRPMAPDGGGTPLSMRSVVDGLRFVRRSRLIAATFLADLNATVLAMPAALFPALAAQFGGGPQAVGWLYAAPGIGGLVAATFSGPLGHIRRQGRALLVAVGVWGAGMAAVGVSPTLWGAVVALSVAGAADIVTGVTRVTIIQTNTPDALRGRLNGLDFVVGAGAPHLGNVRAGAVAAVTGPAASAVTGGLACVAGAILLAVTLPALTRYDAATRRAAEGTASAVEPERTGEARGTGEATGAP